MMKILVCLVILSFTTYSQDKLLNCAFAELLGNGGLYSVNYERLIDEHNSLRLGFSYVDLSRSIVEAHYVSFPFLFNHSFFSQPKQIEVSGGFVIVGNYSQYYSNSPDSFNRVVNTINGTSYFGIREWNEKNKMFFRLGCTQFYNNHGIIITGGLSVGYLF